MSDLATQLHEIADIEDHVASNPDPDVSCVACEYRQEIRAAADRLDALEAELARLTAELGHSRKALGAFMDKLGPVEERAADANDVRELATQLAAALDEAQQAIHSEYCHNDLRHHPECTKAGAALAAAQAAGIEGM